MPSLTLRHACAIVVALLTIGCGQSSPPSATNDGSAAPAPVRQSLSEKDACSLLEPREVEAALGSPLGTRPFLSDQGVPDSEGSACAYEDSSLHRITVAVEWEGAARIFTLSGGMQSMAEKATNGAIHLADGSDLAGEWDEARVMGCCIFVALRGDQMVTIDVGDRRRRSPPPPGLPRQRSNAWTSRSTSEASRTSRRLRRSRPRDARRGPIPAPS